MRRNPNLSDPNLLVSSTPWILLDLSRASWNRLRALGQVPPPIFLVGGKPSWRISDLVTWLQALPAHERPSSRGGRRERAEDATTC
jgi:hypothetical protein